MEQRSCTQLYGKLAGDRSRLTVNGNPNGGRGISNTLRRWQKANISHQLKNNYMLATSSNYLLTRADAGSDTLGMRMIYRCVNPPDEVSMILFCFEPTRCDFKRDKQINRGYRISHMKPSAIKVNFGANFTKSPKFWISKMSSRFFHRKKLDFLFYHYTSSPIYESFIAQLPLHHQWSRFWSKNPRFCSKVDFYRGVFHMHCARKQP